VGYYIEPELSMKSDFFEVKRIKAKEVEVENGLQLLMGLLVAGFSIIFN
jgi:hypothetical protein